MRLLKGQNTNLRNIYGRGLQVDTLDQLIAESTNSIRLPYGTTVQRPSTPSNGQIRYNSSKDRFEAYEDSAWRIVRFSEPFNRKDGHMETLIAVFSALVIGIALAATVQFILGRRGVTQARLNAIGVIEEAEENKRKIVLQAKEEALNIRSTSEKELRDRRSDLNRTERRLNQREEQISQNNESTQKRHRLIEAELVIKQNYQYLLL